jgi:hypothetical protein
VRRLRLTGSGHGANIERWASLVRRSRGSAPLERLRVAARDDIALGELIETLATAPTRAAAVAELNDCIAELSRELEVGAAVPRAAGRIALFSGVGLAVVAVATGLSAAGGVALRPALVAFGSGLLGALACAGLGRAADARSRRQREAWEELRRVLDRVLPSAG